MAISVAHLITFKVMELKTELAIYIWFKTKYLYCASLRVSCVHIYLNKHMHMQTAAYI